MKLSLSFCIPKIEPPNMQPEFQDSILKEFDVIDIENKPEAPWIKRTDDGIVFTDNV